MVASSPTLCSWDTWQRPRSRSSASGRSSPRQSPAWSVRARCCDETPEERRSRSHSVLGPIAGDLQFDDVTFAYEQQKTVLHEISIPVAARLGDCAGRLIGIGQVHDHRADRRLPQAERRQGARGWLGSSTVRLESYRTQLGVVLQDSFLFDGTIRENVAFCTAARDGRGDPARLPHRPR